TNFFFDRIAFSTQKPVPAEDVHREMPTVCYPSDHLYRPSLLNLNSSLPRGIGKARSMINAAIPRLPDGLSTCVADPTNADLDEIDSIDIRVRATTSFDATQRIATRVISTRGCHREVQPSIELRRKRARKAYTKRHFHQIVDITPSGRPENGTCPFLAT